ncbi:hypothetical protein [uncultured Maribacter sp.]|uniref:hypothetical protein n=1 Tax=uncultured Maribacter sp. TaxID=431308 RepID=UPI002602E02C|nr:hypothetical protein [uncultured Maribacter sp.]
MIEEFTTKDRKKEFDKIFKEKIVVFFKTQGFERHTKTSKRIFKDLGNGLSVFIFFEYKTFGHGFYDINIVYFDSEIGDVYDDEYLAMAQIKKPTIRGHNSIELNSSTDLWIEEMKMNIIPFIETNSTHKAILNSDKFYFSKARENECKELMKRKSEKQ